MAPSHTVFANGHANTATVSDDESVGSRGSFEGSHISPSNSSSKDLQSQDVLISEVIISDEKKRWEWDDEKVRNLIVSLYEHKVKKDFEGTDMETDLVKMYEYIRQLMAALYSEEAFGPIEALHLQADASDKKKVKLQRLISNQKKLIKVGYLRAKSKVKQLRQNFKKATINGTRSGSGKLLIEHWDQLVMIWGGCPSLKKLMEL